SFKRNYITINSTDRVGQGSNVAFDASTFEIWGALLNRAMLIIIPSNILLNANDLKHFIRLKKINILWLTTGLFNQHIYADNELFCRIKYLIVGGEALDTKAIMHFQENHKRLPKNLINGYGPTENTTFSLTYKIEEINKRYTSIPIGYPIANTQVYLLDNSLHPTPVGEVGEIYIAGEGLARGYLNREELTKEHFIMVPIAIKNNIRMYKTGDLGCYLPDGSIEYRGRIDNQVKVRGYRIELGEIEYNIYKQKGIQQVIVTTIKDKSKSNQLLAYIVPTKSIKDESSQQKLLTQLDKVLARQLPKYMLPIIYKIVSTLPLTANGKVNHRALGKFENRKVNRLNYIVPASDLEKKLAIIWSKILSINEIGLQEDFFKLGGNSLSAIHLCDSIYKVFAVHITFTDLFNHSTLSALAKIISAYSKDKSSKQYPSIEKVNRNKKLMLSNTQHSLWVLQNITHQPALYNIPVVINLKGKINQQALQEALNHLIQRHEILRTSIKIVGNEPVQIIENTIQLKIQVIKRDNAVINDKDLTKNIKEELQQTIDLQNAPLFRMKLIGINNNNHLLIMLFHHIIFDGFSIEIFFHELGILYNAIEKKMSIKNLLPELTIQYADFCSWTVKSCSKFDVVYGITCSSASSYALLYE
ncbi:MAG: AMP-binding protein, partial [Burkholderiales bacterium]|nr:AMP-binding protein [Burkholderiales bacterium]